MHKLFIKSLLLLICLMVLIISCEPDYSPKRRGFFRIDLPEKQYKCFDTIYPYKFEYPVYSQIKYVYINESEPYWLDIYFPRFDATIHFSYKSIWNNKLNQYIEDAITFINKQIPKATGINEEIIIIPDVSVYGMVYHIEGAEAASTVQFYLTDSIKHFIRGALYFNVTPNNDSLAPVINFIKEDIDYMIETLQWQ